MKDLKTALITGASSGIGAATARLLAQKDIQLILCGRRQERLHELQQELSSKTNVQTLVFDVRNREEVLKSIQSLPESFSKIDILINNAGNAHGLDPIQNGNWEDWDNMIDGNVKGLLYVSQAVIPGMTNRNSGQIINIGSIAAKEVYTNGNVYCASKHAVDAITKGMRIDLNPHGIRVGAIHPGMVLTEFSEVRFKGDKSRAENVYKGFDPLLAKDIAEIIDFMISRPSHVTIGDIVVLPTAQASSTVLHKKSI
ncbi:SDR family NAD(P)-dependent oxidoreductase [Imtechella halotolerans]|uniref:Serine 3-dehydrogenase n=1 Tax=Imtechella halotolerans K1 TaxID=946077 RepID=I0WJP5_9FLAO|nr:SDR family NAD(P)-dependent oxidoreductase [Imtechella halotolerans]EID76611.1 serine 3-dehydrogenase [Imtechella halotolerans K1]WMQ62819.1 SDR family NAD(P)-dependent oxidoreductase [Imtechella halotolerans]